MRERLDIYRCERRPLACTSFSRWTDVEDGYPGIKGPPSISIHELRMSSCFWYRTWMHNDEYLQLSISCWVQNNLRWSRSKAITSSAVAKFNGNATSGLLRSFPGKNFQTFQNYGHHQALIRKVDGPQVCQSFGLSAYWWFQTRKKKGGGVRLPNEACQRVLALTRMLGI